MTTLCYVKRGRLYNGIYDEPIKSPAILIDARSDTVIKWGEQDELQSYYDRYIEAYTQMRIKHDISLLALSELTADEQCFVINRMMNHTLSGFVKAFAEHAKAETEEQKTAAREWLAAKMAEWEQTENQPAECAATV